ncbi:MAG: cytochrome P450 [Chloroflexota bacterium]
MNHDKWLYWHNRPEMMIFGGLVRGFDCLHLPKLGYVVNDPLLARDILMNPAFSSSAHGAMGGLISPLVGDYGLFNMDGDAHKNFKRDLMRLLNPRYVETVVQATLPPLLADLRDRLQAGETVDFVIFTQRMTTAIMLHLLGIDMANDHIDEIAVAINKAVSLFTDMLELNKVTLNAQELAHVQQQQAEVNHLLDTYGQQRPDSLYCHLLAMGLTEAQARGCLLTIISAGTETTNVTLPRILALLLDTKQYQQVRDNRALLDNAIEEGIRVTSASPVIIRAIKADVSIGQYQFKAGRRALLMVYNFMKSSKHLDNPFVFDVQRQIPREMRHLSFGHGAHFCLGYPLAIREIEMALETLFDMTGDITIIKRAYPRGETFPGYRQLEIQREGV